MDKKPKPRPSQRRSRTTSSASEQSPISEQALEKTGDDKKRKKQAEPKSGQPRLSRSRSRTRGRQRSKSVDSEPEHEEKCPCCQSQSDRVASSGLIYQAARTNRAIKATHKRAGDYQPEEDTLLEARADDDWGQKSKYKRKKKPMTGRQMLGKLVEYSVVAGIVVVLFIVVNKKLQQSG